MTDIKESQIVKSLEIPTGDNINYDYINPSHYNSYNGKEVIDLMVDIWGFEKVMFHCEITAFKYRMRVGKKPDQPIERDLEKAKWYEDKALELKKILDIKSKDNMDLICNTNDNDLCEGSIALGTKALG